MSGWGEWARGDVYTHGCWLGFPGGSDDKESPCNAGDTGSSPGSGRSLEKEMAKPAPVFLLENPVDRGA